VQGDGDETDRERAAPRWAVALARLQSTRPRAIVALVAVLTLAAAWPLSHARFSAELSDLLPSDSAAAQAFQQFRAAFGEGDQLVLVALPAEDRAASPAKPTPAEWMAQLRAKLEKREEVRRVESGPLETLQKFAASVLPEAGFAWLKPDEAAQLRVRLTPEGLAAAFARDVRLLEQSPGLDTNEVVRRDPLFLRELLAARAAKLFGGGPALGGESFALLSVSGHRPAQDLPESRRLVAAVEAEIAALRVPAHLRLLKTGGYAIAVEDESRIRRDLEGSTASSILTVLLIAWLAHRRLAPVMFTSIPLLLGIVWGYGLFLALRGGITMLTAAGAAMLVGLGDDYGVHLYAEYSRHRHRGLDARDAKRAMIEDAGPRIAVAALTSVGCFVAFGMTGFRGLADLGLLAAIGLFACLLAFLLVFPLLVRDHRPHEGRTPISYLSHPLAEFPLRRPRSAIAFVALLTLGSVALLITRGPPPFSGDARLLHPEKSPALEALAELDRVVRRPLVPWIVLAEGDDAESLAERFARLEPLLAPLVADGSLSSFELPATALPPRKAQLAAFEALSTPAPLDPARTAAAFRDAADRAGFDPDAFAATETLLRRNLDRAARGATIGLAEMRELGAGALADTFFREGGKTAWPPAGRVAAVAFLFPEGGLFPGEEQSRLAARVQAALSSEPGITLTGFPVVAAELAQRVQQDFRSVTLLAVAVVILLVLASCRSFAATALALLPVSIAIVWLLATMRLTGSPFNVLNIVLMPMLVGLGVDNGIHIVFDQRATGDVGRTLRALTHPMLVSAITTIGGFGSLLFVAHPAIASMGELTAIGLTYDLAATLLVLPPLLLWIRWRRSRAAAAGQNPK
jgi:predicted RND superfamily exporter protein